MIDQKVLKIMVSWHVILCSLVERYQYSEYPATSSSRDENGCSRLLLIVCTR